MWLESGGISDLNVLKSQIKLFIYCDCNDDAFMSQKNVYVFGQLIRFFYKFLGKLARVLKREPNTIVSRRDNEQNRSSFHLHISSNDIDINEFV